MTLALAITCALLALLYVRLALALGRLVRRERERWESQTAINANNRSSIGDLTRTCESLTRSVRVLAEGRSIAAALDRQTRQESWDRGRTP